MRQCRQWIEAFTSRKKWDARSLQDTQLNRCLSLLDLVGLGIFSTSGIGIYVLSAYIARVDSGPSAVLSIIIAGVAALLSALCQAELATRLPRAGAGYIYTYATLGELCAFVVGWNNLLEHMLGAAVAAKAWVHYLDNMVNGTIKGHMSETITWHQQSWILEETPDIPAALVVLVSTLFLLLSVKVYAVIVFILGVCSSLVIISFVCVGFFHVQSDNWTHPPGFFPNGFSGTLTGAALVMFGFSGIDIVVTSIEESKNSTKTVPTAVVLTLTLCFVVYFGVTAALTLAFPWHFLSETAALAKAFEDKHIFASTYVVGVGALFGLICSVSGSLYSIPRLVHSMGKDNLLPQWMSRVNNISSLPIAPALIFGVIASVLACVLKFESTIQMFSISTIFGFTLSAFCVLCLRYQTGYVGLYREYCDPSDVPICHLHSHLPSHFNRPPPRLEIMANGDMKMHYSEMRASRSDGCLYCEESGFECSSKSYNQLPVPGELTERTGFYHESQCYDTTVKPTVSRSSLNSLIKLPSDTLLDPNDSTWKSTVVSIVVFTVSATLMCSSCVAISLEGTSGTWWAITIISMCSVFMVTSALVIAKQPQNKTKLYFSVPYVPLVPLLCITINMFLMSALPAMSWIRFTIWIALGLVVYLGYGVRKSNERLLDDQEVVLYDITNPSFCASG
ncbi:hypothetical protein SNE40_013975 [Patella caerulea]|uniref:Cationic amino acid transporter C-terminal domain-containing protein n=1 Tax=Patella caerulea TaxID=87958 RepID=A0AAN8PI61_PATCE